MEEFKKWILKKPIPLTKEEIIQKSEENINLAKDNINKFYEEYNEIRVNNGVVDFDSISILIKKYGLPINNKLTIKRTNRVLEGYQC